MKNATRILLHQYLERQAELNGSDPEAAVRGLPIEISATSFTAGTPSVQQRLITKQQEDSSFLAAINMVPVEEISGEKLGLGISGPLASRTATNTDGSARRQTTSPTSVDAEGYLCKQTNSDTHLTYALLDMWAKFPDFQVRISDAIRKRQALDRIMIGFNGTSAAATTNKGANPLLQDVNIGWLQQYRSNRPAAVLTEGETEDGKIIIDPTGAGDYKNVHGLVVDAIHNLMPSWARNDSDLVVILGENLQHDIFFPLVDGENKPTEMIAADLLLSAKRIGGKRGATVPFMIPDGIFITRLDNLSIYEQEGKRRRTVKEEPALNCVQTFESSNDAFVVEDYDYGCLIENVQFGPTGP